MPPTSWWEGIREAGAALALPAHIPPLSFQRASPCTGPSVLSLLPSQGACRAASTAGGGHRTELQLSLVCRGVSGGLWVRASQRPYRSPSAQSSCTSRRGGPRTVPWPRGLRSPEKGPLPSLHTGTVCPHTGGGAGLCGPCHRDLGVPCKRSGRPSLPPGWAADPGAAGEDQKGGFPALSGRTRAAQHGADSASARVTRSGLGWARHVTRRAAPRP